MKQVMNFGDRRAYPPSHFAALGQPLDSRWAKSEIEQIALAYVTALANDGNTWRRLTREQVRKLLTPAQARRVEGLLDSSLYDDWFQMVADQITGPEGAFGVRGSWKPAA